MILCAVLCVVLSVVLCSIFVAPFLVPEGTVGTGAELKGLVDIEEDIERGFEGDVNATFAIALKCGIEDSIFGVTWGLSWGLSWGPTWGKKGGDNESS